MEIESGSTGEVPGAEESSKPDRTRFAPRITLRYATNLFDTGEVGG